MSENERKLIEEVEQLRCQLAGCSVAANGGVSSKQLATQGDYGWSRSYQDVVDLYSKYENMLKMAEALWQLLDDVDSADDLAKGDDEAYRLLARARAKARLVVAESQDGQTLVWKTTISKSEPHQTLFARLTTIHTNWRKQVVELEASQSSGAAEEAAVLKRCAEDLGEAIWCTKLPLLY